MRCVRFGEDVFRIIVLTVRGSFTKIIVVWFRRPKAGVLCTNNHLCVSSRLFNKKTWIEMRFDKVDDE